ncbi:hypothetical protein GF361_04810 [Candidatus Woesearchaeota archaeon]|nr:hypothetical protein [Candidatus Woesearchaeota archaeon]
MGKRITYRNSKTLDDFIVNASYKSKTKPNDFFVDISARYIETDMIKASMGDDAEKYDMRFEFIDTETDSNIYKISYTEHGAILKDESEIPSWIRDSLDYVSKKLSEYGTESELQNKRLRVASNKK